ncbi:MAG: hypothetical protein IKS75_01585 [Clostridiales bacterium]|nr:hypothetical protein [Clostridiales bacterium]
MRHDGHKVYVLQSGSSYSGYYDGNWFELKRTQDNATITYTFAGSTKVYYEYSVRITIATHTPTPTVKISIVTHTPTPTVKISIATQTPTPSAGTAVQAPTYYGGTWHESDENYWAPYVTDITGPGGTKYDLDLIRTTDKNGNECFYCQDVWNDETNRYEDDNGFYYREGNTLYSVPSELCRDVTDVMNEYYTLHDP